MTILPSSITYFCSVLFIAIALQFQQLPSSLIFIAYSTSLLLDWDMLTTLMEMCPCCTDPLKEVWYAPTCLGIMLDINRRVYSTCKNEVSITCLIEFPITYMDFRDCQAKISMIPLRWRSFCFSKF